MPNAGDLIRASDLDGTFAAYTPTLTGFVLGNGTLIARYTQQNKRVTGWVQFTLGSTSSASSTPAVSLPVAVNAAYVFGQPLGGGWILDSSAALRRGCIAHWWGTAGGSAFLTDPGVPASETVTSASPFAWAVSDQFFLQFAYEAA